MVEDAPPPRIGPAMVTYIAAVLAALCVWLAWHPQGLALALTLAAPLAAMGWLIRQAYRRRRASNCSNPAQRRYTRRAVPLMIAYVAFLAVSLWLRDNWAPTGLLAVALAILPALPLVGVIWALGRLLVEEQDEYLRMLMVRQTLWASAFALSVATVWGFLESFDMVGHVEAYYVAVLWFGGLGLGACINKLTLGAPVGC
jgi:hypothetical protein